jgi:FkbM family methyltransferase
MKNGAVKAWGTLRNIFLNAPVAISGTWDSDVLSIIVKRIGMPLHTVIDVGAHAGEFARAVRTVLPNVHILCFEPLQACQAPLTRMQSEIGKCDIFPVALGSTNETATMYCNAFTPSSSLLPMLPLHTRAFPQTFWTRKQRVSVRRMDDVLQGHSLQQGVLLKIDVQGFEDKVLAGATATLRNVQAILLETTLNALYEKQVLEPELTSLLEQNGFQHVGDFGNIRHMFTGQVMQRDALFLRA